METVVETVVENVVNVVPEVEQTEQTEPTQTKVKRTRKNFNVSEEQFLNFWNEENTKTVRDVVQKTGMNLNAVNVRAYLYRKAGKVLKQLERAKKGQ